MRVRLRVAGGVLAVLGAPCAVTGIANAQVFQTDAAMTPLPQPVGTAEMNLVTASYAYSAATQSYEDPTTGALLQTPITYGQYYAPPAFPQFVDGDAITLAGLFKWRKEHIDPIADAKTAPGHFFPGCGFTAELVLRGGACSSALGWYNVPTGDTTPPAAAAIFPLVPGDASYLNSARIGFTPLGWDNRDPHDLFKIDWTPKSFSSGAILSDPHYTGGDIGFALVGDPQTQCSQNKFSVYEHNVKNSSGIPWITALIYKSTVDPTGIYLAFEDLPMSTADWHLTGVPGSNGNNDGDFNDFVFFISGLGSSATCQDPRCATVSCSAGTVCSAGVCVPGSTGGGGAGAGGTGASGAGGMGAGGGNTSGGDTSAAGADTGAVPAAGGLGSGGSESSGSGGDAPTGGASPSTAGTSDTASAGANAATIGGAATTTTVTNGGCSCRIGSHGATRYQLVWLAMSAAFVLRRRRFQRAFRRRAARAIDSR